MSAVEAVLRLEGATRRYAGGGRDPGFELTVPALSVDAGSWTVFTGRSGSGKTTLLQLLAGLDRADAGQQWMFGREITAVSEAALAGIRRDRLGIVYQDLHFVDHLPVWQNVTCRLVPAGVSARDRRERARTVLARFDVDTHLDRAPRLLSGGERQRVALARALAGDPDVLIADEPTSNVDGATAAGIVDALRELREAGTTIVLSTHDPALLEPADTRHVLEGGRLIG